MKLNAQVALVTGASGGIGSAICHALAKEGASLILHYHNRPERAQELRNKWHDPKQKFLVLGADLSKDSEVKELLKKYEYFAQLDVLINNSGWTKVVSADDLDSLDEELLTKTLQMKIHAPVYLVRQPDLILKRRDKGKLSILFQLPVWQPEALQ